MQAAVGYVRNNFSATFGRMGYVRGAECSACWCTTRLDGVFGARALPQNSAAPLQCTHRRLLHRRMWHRHSVWLVCCRPCPFTGAARNRILGEAKTEAEAA